MNKLLRVLIIEDSEDDAELIVIELEKSGYELILQRVDTEIEMKKALESSTWDVVLADYSLPTFDAIAALNLLKEENLDLPFIIISGKIGEDTAVAAMKAGAHDYLLKGKLARLLPAIERELREALLRKEHRQAQAKLRHLAFYDELTDLPNRTLFLEQIEQAITVKAEENRNFAVILLNLTRFNVVKYSLGHALGDQLLMTTAQRLAECLEQNDLIARVNTNEFGVLIRDLAELEEAKVKARLIQKSLSNSFKLDGPVIFSSTSIGIVLSTVSYRTAQDYLKAADTAMHYASQSTGGIALFDKVMHTSAVERINLETHLQKAIKNQHLHLNYQPIVNLKNGNLTGFEALVRWEHPKLGKISPAKFIPLSEETGLILPLGKWVLTEACRHLLLWQEQIPACAALSVNVNLSGIQIIDEDFVIQIDELLQSLGLKGENLKLEITESILMENASATTFALEQLKQRNIKLCIDDFGTGYSSLSYLHYLPIDTLKIDRCFVNNQDDPKNRDIIRAIINLAHDLELEVVAEGIETQQQLVWLQELGCDYGQGYLFARPLDSDSAKNLIASAWSFDCTENNFPLNP